MLMYYWLPGWVEHIPIHTAAPISNHKSVYWFNDQTLSPSPFANFGSEIHLENCFIHFNFLLVVSQQALKFYFLCASAIGEGQLTKQVTKSFDKGELRDNDRINISRIDEHEAPTWHLSSNYTARQEDEKNVSTK